VQDFDLGARLSPSAHVGPEHLFESSRRHLRHHRVQLSIVQVIVVDTTFRVFGV
jgi:hypothetical protein